MLSGSLKNSTLLNFLLILGDGDFSNVLHRIPVRKYNALFALTSQGSTSFTAAARDDNGDSEICRSLQGLNKKRWYILKES